MRKVNDVGPTPGRLCYAFWLAWPSAGGEVHMVNGIYRDGLATLPHTMYLSDSSRSQQRKSNGARKF